jgi:sec-independent protein translocase protein TatA
MQIIGWPELILVLAILIFLFGATKMKDLAKGLGGAVKEFRKATDTAAGKEDEVDEAILQAARRLGIATEGKDTQQLLREMEAKTQSA